MLIFIQEKKSSSYCVAPFFLQSAKEFDFFFWIVFQKKGYSDRSANGYLQLETIFINYGGPYFVERA